MPQGGGCQHASNVFPSGGHGDVKEAAASIDAARTDDVRRNPTDAHQRRPLRGRSSAYPQAAPPLPFLRGCSANSSGGRAAGHPRPLPRSAPADTCFAHHRALLPRVRMGGAAPQALFHQEVSRVFISPGMSSGFSSSSPSQLHSMASPTSRTSAEPSTARV